MKDQDRLVAWPPAWKSCRITTCNYQRALELLFFKPGWTAKPHHLYKQNICRKPCYPSYNQCFRRVYQRLSVSQRLLTRTQVLWVGDWHGSFLEDNQTRDCKGIWCLVFHKGLNRQHSGFYTTMYWESLEAKQRHYKRGLAVWQVFVLFFNLITFYTISLYFHYRN